MYVKTSSTIHNPGRGDSQCFETWPQRRAAWLSAQCHFRSEQSDIRHLPFPKFTSVKRFGQRLSKAQFHLLQPRPTPIRAENSPVSGSGVFVSLLLAGFVLVWGFSPLFARGGYYVSRSSNPRSKDRRSKND